MLSNVDIIKQLGKNIAIYPLTKDTIQGSSIDLTASDLAWFLSERKSAINIDEYEKGYILIAPHDTCLIQSAEIVGVRGKIAGLYHSIVGVASDGTGHIG